MSKETTLASPSGAPSQPTPRKRRWGVIIIGGLFGLLPLLALLAPTLLSTAAGTGFILNQANTAVPGKIILHSLSLSWFGGQQVTGLSIAGPQGNTVIKAGSITLPGTSLLTLALGKRDLGEIVVEGLDTHIIQHNDGTTNLERALSTFDQEDDKAEDTKKQEPGQKAEQHQRQGGFQNEDHQGREKKAGRPIDLKAKLLVLNASLTFDAPKMQTVRARHINATLVVAGLENLTAELKALIEQGQDKGSIDLTAHLKSRLDNRGEIQVANTDIDASVQLTKFPLAVADRLAEQNGQLVALLGAALDGKILIQGNLTNLKATVTVDSENLHTKAALRAKDNVVVVAPGGVMRLRVTPAAFAGLATDASARLEKPFELALNLESIQLSQPATGLNLHDSTGKASFTLSDILLDTGKSAGKVELKATKGSVSFSGELNTFTCALSATGVQDGKSGQIQMAATLLNAINGNGAFTTKALTADVSCAIGQFPLAVADSLGQLDGKLVALLGPMLDGKLLLKGSPQNLKATVVVDSENLHTQAALNMKDDAILVTPGGVIRLKVTPAAFSTLTTNSKATLELPFELALNLESIQVGRQATGIDLRRSTGKSGFTIGTILINTGGSAGKVQLKDTHGAFTFDGSARTMTCKLNATGVQDGHSGQIEVTTTLQNAISPSGAFDTKALTAKGSCMVSQFPLALVDELVQLNGLMTSALGPLLDATLTANLTPSADGKGVNGPINLTLKAENLTGTLAAKLTPRDIQIQPGANLALTIKPAVVAEALRQFASDLPDTKKITLLAATTLRASVDQLTLPIDNATVASLLASVKVQLDALELDSGRLAGHLGLDATTLEMAFDGGKGTAIFNLKSAVTAQGNRGPLLAKVNMANLLDATGAIAPLGASGKVTVQLTKLPTALIELFAGHNGGLAEILGDRLELIELNATSGTLPKKITNFTAKVQSEQLKVNLAGQVESNLVTVKNGSTIDYTLTPQALVALQASPDKPSLALDRNAPCHLTMKDTQIAFLPKPEGSATPAGATSIDPGRTRLAMTVNVDAASFRRLTDNQRVSIGNLMLTLGTPNPAQVLNLNLTANITAGSEEASQLVSKTQVLNLLDSRGVLNTAGMKLNTQTTAAGLPVDVLGALAGENDLATVIGKTAALTLKASYTGSQGGDADFAVETEHVKVAAKADIDKDLVLALSENGKASLAITPEIATALLGKINPMLVNALGPKNPGDRAEVVLEKGFTLNLNSFDPKTINGKTTFVLPPLTMKSGWGISGFLNMLSTLGIGGDPRQTFTANFSPLLADIQKGIIVTNDLWFTSDDLILNRLIALGTKVDSINLNNEQTAVALGISGQTLLQIVSLQNLVKTDTVYELPIRGPLANLKPDYRGLIRSFVAKKAKGKLSTSLGGMNPLLTDLFNRATKKPKDEPDQETMAERWPGRPTKPITPSEPVEGETKPTETPTTPTPVPAETGKTKETKPTQKNTLRGFLDLLKGD